MNLITIRYQLLREGYQVMINCNDPIDEDIIHTVGNTTQHHTTRRPDDYTALLINADSYHMDQGYFNGLWKNNIIKKLEELGYIVDCFVIDDKYEGF
jgi:hypothetical protein